VALLAHGRAIDAATGSVLPPHLATTSAA